MLVSQFFMISEILAKSKKSYLEFEKELGNLKFDSNQII